jgi:hypothetical protein
VTDQETRPAREFVRLLRNHNDGQFLARKIGARKIDSFGGIDIFHVDDSGLGTAPAGRLESLK